MIKEKPMQIWMEKVGESQDCSVIISEGRIKGE
jgi:hypothetical protein